MLVAPVEVGDGAYTAAGSVIAKDVPPGALGRGPGAAAQHRGLGGAAAAGHGVRGRGRGRAADGARREPIRTLDERGRPWRCDAGDG